MHPTIHDPTGFGAYSVGAPLDPLPELEPAYEPTAAEKPQTARGTILETANTLVHGDRNRDYGDPVDNHRHIARIANAILGTDLSARDVALILTALKLARLAKNRGHTDSYVDGAAYLAIAYECATRGD